MLLVIGQANEPIISSVTESTDFELDWLMALSSLFCICLQFSLFSASTLDHWSQARCDLHWNDLGATGSTGTDHNIFAAK